MHTADKARRDGAMSEVTGTPELIVKEFGFEFIDALLDGG